MSQGGFNKYLWCWESPPTSTAFWLDRHWWCHHFMRHTLVMSFLYAFWSWSVYTNFPAVLAKNKARQVWSIFRHPCKLSLFIQFGKFISHGKLVRRKTDRSYLLSRSPWWLLRNIYIKPQSFPALQNACYVTITVDHPSTSTVIVNSYWYCLVTTRQNSDWSASPSPRC